MEPSGSGTSYRRPPVSVWSPWPSPITGISSAGSSFSAHAAKEGVKPILGCEVYLAPHSRFDNTATPNGTPKAYHLILLVEDHEGYKNLSRLVTLGHLEGFYYHPRVDMELLRQYHSGLICLSACLKGRIPSS